jgi:predicted RNase H-like HicB family nuclease
VFIRVDSWLNHPETSGTKVNRYLIVVEETPSGYSAYSPDVPGCVAAASTRSKVQREMHDAIEFHIEGLRAVGEEIPKPRSEALYCEVAT